LRVGKCSRLVRKKENKKLHNLVRQNIQTTNADIVASVRVGVSVSDSMRFSVWLVVVMHTYLNPFRCHCTVPKL